MITMIDHVGTVLFNTRYVSRPSGRDFVRGARAAFNLSGATTCEYYLAPSAADADWDAAQNDWDAVYEDFEQVLHEAFSGR